jgi:hypothetical protein
MPTGPGILASFLHQLIAALDTGKYQHIPVAEVEAHIRAGDLFPYLVRTLGEDVDLSFFDAEGTGLPEDARARARARAAAMNNRLLRIVDAFTGREQWGVQRSGLCLLLTYGVFMLKLQAAQTHVKMRSKDATPLDLEDAGLPDASLGSSSAGPTGDPS